MLQDAENKDNYTLVSQVLESMYITLTKIPLILSSLQFENIDKRHHPLIVLNKDKNVGILCTDRKKMQHTFLPQSLQKLDRLTTGPKLEG